MKNVKLAARYAKALYEFSLEKDQLEKVYQDVLHIMGLLKLNQELNKVIECPIVSHSKKVKIFSEVFRNTISEISFGFLRLVVDKRREPELMLICAAFIKQYYRFHNIRIVLFITAQPVSDEIVQKLKDVMQERTGAQIEVKCMVDSRIIGGFIVKIDDFLYDASILRQMNTLKREFSHNIYRAGF